MSNMHALIITNNHLLVLPQTCESIKTGGMEVTIVDLGSTDGTQQWAEENEVALLQTEPILLAKTVNEFFQNLDSEFMFFMYGNETIRGDLLNMTSAIPIDVAVATVNARASAWVNDVLSRDDFFLESRVFRSNRDVVFIGSSRLYAIFAPTTKTVSLPAIVDRHLGLAFNINSEALYEQISSGNMTLSQIQALHRISPEELFIMFRNTALCQRLNDAAENIAGLSNGLVVLQALHLLENNHIDAFEKFIKSICDANEAGQGNVHATYCALLESSYMDIALSERERVLNLIEVQGKRLADFAEDDFADDLLPGSNQDKSNHICCITAIRLEKNEEASNLVEDLQISPLAGLETQLLSIECMQNSGDGEALQASLSDLEPLLSHHSFADAWLLSACGCVLLDNLSDIESLWHPAYIQSRMGFISPHRRHVLSGMFAMVSMLSGNPIEGHGAYGAMGAIMRRRPLPSRSQIPLSVIERSVNAMLLHNCLGNLTPLFERRAEALVPGIQDYVIQHLATLGFPVEDDGEPRPIFLIGDRHGIFQALFGNEKHFKVEAGVCSLTEEIESSYDALQDVREQEFDAFSWLDAEEGESEEDILEKIRSSCRQLAASEGGSESLRIVDPSVTFEQLEILTEGLIDGSALIVIEDPREYVQRQGAEDEQSILRALLQWERNIVQMRKLLSTRNYRYVETTPWLMLSGTLREMERISASIGEPIPLEQFDAVMAQLKHYQSQPKPSDALIAAVNHHGGQQLRRFGFPV